MKGEVPIHCWLLLIAEGRYRLLSREQVESDSQLESIRSLTSEVGPLTQSEATTARDGRTAALAARLLLTTATPPKPAWRIALPKAMEIFAPSGCDPDDFSILLSLEGHWEIWYTEVLRKVAFLPLSLT